MRRYVEWLACHGRLVGAIAGATFAVAAYLAVFHLPLRADFSQLLPQDAPAVEDLRKLEARVTSQDTLLVVVVCPDETKRAAIAARLAADIRALPDTLVSRVEVDDAITRAFLYAHRFLFVPYDDLITARDALRQSIDQAKQAANPVLIRLDDDDPKAKQQLAELRDRQAKAKARAEKSSFISDDRTAQLIVVRTAFARSAVSQGVRLLDEVRTAADRIRADDSTVEIGVAAGVVSAVAEHRALVRGMLISSIVTALLVALVLVTYFRSLRLLVVLSIALVVGTVASFGVAALAVGQLNAATAFLGAIIAGNGVNYGILLIARYLEERRTSDPNQAMTIAIAETLRPTLVASLGAAIAYGSLAATSFRGFSDFAVIGGVGMLLCWISSYTLLPVLVLRWAPSGRDQRPGNALGFLAFRRPIVVCALAGLVFAGAGWLSYRYIERDPFEYDLKNLRSRGDDALEARRWVELADAKFGRGIAGQTYIAVDRVEDVPQVVAALRELDPNVIGTIRSLVDVVPDRQPEKLAVLAEIRALIAEAGNPELDALQPGELGAISIEQVPEEILVRLRERDGRIGRLIGVRPAAALDEWDGRALIRFATAVRRLRLHDGRTITTSGNQVIYADIIDTLRSDGPRVVIVALICLVIMTVLLAGGARRAIAVLASIVLGAVAMIALCDAVGIKVTFLDFVALPITLGLGVDYAINIACGPQDDLRRLLRTSGMAVFMCSLTTVIGYGSLLVSDNGAIRGFGLAALIGEICCVATALIVVPALLRRSWTS